jgi:hypothetical protein
MGTLFAFALVCAGVLVLQERDKIQPRRPGFRVPHIAGTLIIPLLLAAYMIMSFPHERAEWSEATAKGESVLSYLYHKIPMLIFLVLFIAVTYFTVRRRWSLIPVLGILTNMYLMSELSTINWIRFLIWCGIGLAIYFLYSRRNSKLNTSPAS